VSTPDELRELVESYLAELALTPELKGLEESMRDALAGGGKRVRPVLCLATAEAAGAEAEAALPAAAALELVHNFSLVHDDLPALDDDSERRGKRFFEDVVDFSDLKHGACAACHSGPMLNETNQFAELVFGVPKGTRFQSIGISEVNSGQNLVRVFLFKSHDGTTTPVASPDPGRALITGVAPQDDPTVENVNAFKTPTLWGASRTAPYFHDNSAKTLEDVAAHYNLFFGITSDPDGPGGPIPPLLSLTPGDQADIVSYLKLLK